MVVYNGGSEAVFPDLLASFAWAEEVAWGIGFWRADPEGLGFSVAEQANKALLKG